MAEAARRDDWPRSIEEFEAWHARQPERWEFVGGEPRLTAPGSMKHAIIKNNVGFALRHALAGTPCTALVDGPQIVTDEISAIPDVVVTCAPLDLTTPVIAAPAIIVGEADDIGRKWISYSKIPSLKHYLVLSQDERVAQVHSRAGDLWRERFIRTGAIELDDPPLRLEIDAIYAATDLAA